MQAFGESKKEAAAHGEEKDKIYSFNTYKSYWKHTKYFIKYIKEKHPEINLVAIDYDSGATRVNQENRIRLMLSNAKKD